MDLCDKTVEEIERDHRIEQLANRFVFVWHSIDSLRSESSPYPTQVLQTLEKIHEDHRLILKSRREDYYQDAITKAIDDQPDITKWIGTYALNPKSFNLNDLKMEAFDKYFLNYRDYWETAISSLKRPSAVVNRRKYLIEKIEEWKTFLKSQKIKKYDSILDEYSYFNKAELSGRE